MAHYPDSNIAVAEIVTERRFTSAGPGDWHFLKLGDGRLIPLGDDKDFAEGFRWAIVRNVCERNDWVRGTTTNTPLPAPPQDNREG